MYNVYIIESLTRDTFVCSEKFKAKPLYQAPRAYSSLDHAVINLHPYQLGSFGTQAYKLLTTLWVLKFSIRHFTNLFIGLSPSYARYIVLVPIIYNFNKFHSIGGPRDPKLS